MLTPERARYLLASVDPDTREIRYTHPGPCFRSTLYRHSPCHPDGMTRLEELYAITLASAWNLSLYDTLKRIGGIPT